jgi:hypothetical protein
MSEKYYVESNISSDALLLGFLKRTDDVASEIGPSEMTCSDGIKRFLYEVPATLKGQIIMSQKKFSELRYIKFFVSKNEEPPKECVEETDETVRIVERQLYDRINKRLNAMSEKIETRL